jgi:hypothetical protein
LVTGPGWGTEGKTGASSHRRFDVRTLGKGRIAVSREALSDPWAFVIDVQTLLSRANDVAKLFNASASGGFNYAASPDGKRALLQLLSYSSGGRSSTNATAWTRHKYRDARLWTIDGGPTPVEVAACEDGGTEYHLPSMAAYIALDFEV